MRRTGRRFTVRRLMAAVAVVAVLLGVGLGIERERLRRRFLRAAAGCADGARRARDCADDFERRASREGSHPINRRMAEQHRLYAAFFDRARDQWERAAARPWPALAPEDSTSNPEPPPIQRSEFPDVSFGGPFPL